LIQVIEQRRRSSFKDAMPDKLRSPGSDINADGIIVDYGGVAGGKVIGVDGEGEKEGGEGGASDRLEEDIKDAVG